MYKMVLRLRTIEKNSKGRQKPASAKLLAGLVESGGA